MALVALDRLGASPARLVEFFERHEADLTPARTVERTLTPATWQDHVGTGERYSDLRAYFDRQLASAGTDVVLREHLHPLVGSFPNHLFHCVIRLAYALDAGHVGQVAAALAYLADTPGQPGGPAGPATLPSLDALAATSLRACVAHPDLYALHTVTGSKALRAVLPHLSTADRAAALQHFGPRSRGCTARSPCERARWTRTSEQARTAGRCSSRTRWRPTTPHVIKLVYSCRVEEARTGDPAYRAAAAEVLAHRSRPG